MIKKSEIFKIIHDIRDKYSVKVLCNISKVSRSGYYKWAKFNKLFDKDFDIKEKVLEIYNKTRKVYGYRRIKIELFRAYGLIVNNKKILRIMRDLGIKSKIRRKKFKYNNPKTLDMGRVEPNLLNRDFTSDKPNNKWVTDITYIKYNNGNKRIYLSAIEDLYNREIISYKISTNLDMSFVEDTIGEAFSRLTSSQLSNLTIHSDQGVHYKSISYKSILKENKVIQSMSRKGNCYDNACIENFFGHLKSELIYQNSYTNMDDLIKDIEGYIHWYNNDRVQIKLKNMAPVEYRCHMAA